MIQPPPDASIEDYAAIGDCRTLALVSRFGSIDWCCLPDFSSPSVFAALLDRQRGGCFALAPRQLVKTEQRYEPGSNVLKTTFHCTGGALELMDCMTVTEARGTQRDEQTSQEIVRLLSCVEGICEVDATFQPRPGYAAQHPRIEAQGNGRWVCTGQGFQAQLLCSLPLRQAEADSLRAAATLRKGDMHAAVLQVPQVPTGGDHGITSVVGHAQKRLAATADWWRAWCGRCVYGGKYRDAVMRSALALKLLDHRATGAVVAAGTTSLPACETGARNWDYRYCWLRDTSLVLHAFTDLGYTSESDAFLRWLLHATGRTRPMLQVLYDVHGGTELQEKVVPQLRGYHGIGPVRVGNAASSQVQHDIYGEVILTACDHVDAGGELTAHEKDLLAGFVEVVCDIWRKPDHGIWEIRLPPRHNTHSKLMCWAALDRALRLHERIGLRVNTKRVALERDAIRSDIDQHGYDSASGTYIGFYGSRAPDASLLLMPRMGYLAPRDPRMLRTLDRIVAQLSDTSGLLYRYPPGGSYDGVEGTEHLFAICSFWCVDCLARIGRIDEAEEMFERLLALRNHAGLYAEQFAASDGRPIGNFPQAFSHVGSITAALSLDTARRGAMPSPEG